jgi:hypothetical protein
MKKWKSALFVITLSIATLAVNSTALAAATTDELVIICTDLFAGVFGV